MRWGAGRGGEYNRWNRNRVVEMDMIEVDFATESSGKLT